MRCPYADDVVDVRTAYRVMLLQENDLNSIIDRIRSGSNSNSVIESISSNSISGNNLLVVSLRRNLPASGGTVAFAVSRGEILSDREQCLRFVNQNIMVSSNEPPPQDIVQQISDLLYDYASIMERDPLNSNHRVLMIYMRLAISDLTQYAAGFPQRMASLRSRTAEHRRQDMEVVLGVRGAVKRSRARDDLLEEAMKRCRVRFDDLKDFDDRIICSICLEGFDSGDVITKTFCTHIYHEGCIVKWLKIHRTCPMCRTRVKTKQFKLDS